MNQDAINKLNSITKVKLAPSKNGIGVFAIRDISMAEKMYLDQMPEVYRIPYSSFGKLFKEVKKLILERWPRIVNGGAFVYPDVRFLAYVNHSDKGLSKPDRPNYSEETDTALRDIKEGDEILMNYRLIDNYEKVYPFLKKK